jgi:ankyrin repeat protein
MKTSVTLLLLCALLLALPAPAQPRPASTPPKSAASIATGALEARLYEALKSNDTASVKRLLKQRIDLNKLYQHSRPDVRATAYHSAPFLYWALLFGCCQEIRNALIASGADVNFRFSEPEDVTLLMQSAYQFPAASVKFLIDHGARVNDRTRSGRTALMFAVTDSDPALGERYGGDAAKNAELLISRGARVRIRDRNGHTAAMVAAKNYNGSAEALALLLAHGAKVNEADAVGVTPLMCAAQPANLKAVKLLLRHGASVKARDRDGQTALMHAFYPHCSKSDLSGVIEALTRAGANINAQDRQGETVLDYATAWKERLGSTLPLLHQLGAVHGSNPILTEIPPTQ